MYAGTGDSGQIFVFDGVSWSNMGVAFGGTFYDLLAYNGKLYTVYDTVYAYDGVSWAVAQPSIGAISLAVYDNKLFVGTANTGLVHQFDGTTWSSVWVTSEPILTELEVHDGKLYLGTNPGGHIYAFDGSSWSLCFDSPEETVGALASFNGMLFAGTSSSGLIYLMGGTAPSSVDLYLHASGSTLFLDNLAPGGSTAKFRDSSSLNFNSGNPWKEIGTWDSVAGSIPPPATTLTELGDLKVWLGLKNSDDQGTRFDLRAEVYKNGVPIAAGETLCITGVTRNPALAKEVLVAFGTIPSVSITSTDVISVKILARIGTDGAGGLCGGHSNAVGVRMYFDSLSRPANLKATF
ncbi:MAG: PQQ-like beta-propeller repeat protein [Acidobacteria bacterium]|nr:PQQ-like beta-propeller repeat protein [Acidobacteriota bacterium]